jgi:hypothetical protein
MRHPAIYGRTAQAARLPAALRLAEVALSN